MSAFQVGDKVKTGNLKIASAQQGYPGGIEDESRFANRVGQIIRRSENGVYWRVQFSDGTESDFAEWDMEKLENL